ncbi:hypothetical protein [Leptospira ainazelensis]|nr:hypothetical protein [Leptospira ainazelensis]
MKDLFFKIEVFVLKALGSEYKRILIFLRIILYRRDFISKGL